jgi:hypothetical protein
MHRTSGLLAAVRGSWGDEALRVRIAITPGASRNGAVLVLRFGEDGSLAARLPLDGPDSGPLGWEGPQTGAGGGEPGSYARGAWLEAMIPLGRIPRDGRGGVVWRVELERGGKVEERAPREGWLHHA